MALVKIKNRWVNPDQVISVIPTGEDTYTLITTRVIGDRLSSCSMSEDIGLDISADKVAEILNDAQKEKGFVSKTAGK
jgi:hypothetical protein